MHALLGNWPPTQACALMGNQTSHPLVHRLALSPLSHTSQGSYFLFNFFEEGPFLFWPGKKSWTAHLSAQWNGEDKAHLFHKITPQNLLFIFYLEPSQPHHDCSGNIEPYFHADISPGYSVLKLPGLHFIWQHVHTVSLRIFVEIFCSLIIPQPFLFFVMCVFTFSFLLFNSSFNRGINKSVCNIEQNLTICFLKNTL